MKRRSFKQDKIARVYDDEILPLWTQKFGRLLLRSVQVPPKAMVLNVACKTGYPALELLEKMDENSRIIAIESSGPLLDIARSKAGELSGRRIFFRTEHLSGKLSFADDVYDVTFTNLGLDEFDGSPEEVIKDFARVTQPGGQVLVTLPLRGSWSEFFDIYREVLVKQDKNELLETIEDYVESFPTPEIAVRWMRDAGLRNITVDKEKFDLLFKSAREFFFAPVIEYGPLKTWKSLVGKGQQMQDIFWYIKEAIDAYFSSTAFSVSVVASCIYGFKPTEEQLMEDSDDPTESIDLEATFRAGQGAAPDPAPGEWASGAAEKEDPLLEEESETFTEEDLHTIFPEEEEEDTDVESIVTDAHPSSKRRSGSGSFGGDASVATVDERPSGEHAVIDELDTEEKSPSVANPNEGGDGGAGQPPGRPSLQELEAAFDEVDGRGQGDDSRVDPFSEMRSSEAQPLKDEDIEELDIIEEFDELDEELPTLQPSVPTLEHDIDDEDLPTMERGRPDPNGSGASPGDSTEELDHSDDEEIDPDDIPTKGPHLSPLLRGNRGKK